MFHLVTFLPVRQAGWGDAKKLQSHKCKQNEAIKIQAHIYVSKLVLYRCYAGVVCLFAQPMVQDCYPLRNTLLNGSSDFIRLKTRKFVPLPTTQGKKYAFD
jgi:hypothetical protein